MLSAFKANFGKGQISGKLKNCLHIVLVKLRVALCMLSALKVNFGKGQISGKKNCLHTVLVKLKVSFCLLSTL